MRNSTVRQARLSLAAIALAVALSVGGCGAGSSSTEGSRPGAPAVLATTGILADITSQVAGNGVQVTQLVPDGASPHNYAPSAKEQQLVADADLLVYTAPALEQSLPLDVAPTSWALIEHTGEPRTPSAAEAPVQEGAEDPHVWLDPRKVAAALPDLAAALTEADPAGAAGYERRAAAYATELVRLDTELAREIDTIPTADRKLVTSHDVIGYYADRYGLQVIGAPFGLAPEAEASAGRLAELIAEIEAQGVPAVFAQQGDDPEVLRRVADEAGVLVVDDLLLESLGPQADSYAAMMRFSTARISEALGGRGGAAG